MAQSALYNRNVFTSLVEELSRLIDGEVIITNEQGMIVASTDRDRLGAFHEGAQLAMQKKEQTGYDEGNV
ncbi:sugar diacid recognition domain-containing protein [Virgibacillus halophilus]|uniref:Sugar diacid recognition domain-containing protein n=1 Tax=Tigheibacillus halophilus TaxID=361280 RepID=A0ABU5C5M1_9BACI|nr:sugar diacid recognition domain-containing protein [Virgibacillus halophilus]